ncbi:Bem46 protein [hydrothermal vent metagenome]|uniref:Bem46 protein n=1 Tax=hydrothermal vent metagenome TaxID=652676 RepID=A0A160TUU8_9ZZZZ
MRTIFFLLISGIFLYALLILVLFFMQRSLLYFPSNERLDLSQYAAIGLQEVKLKTEDGLELTAWFMRPDSARDGRTFLLFHGNAGHIGHRVEKFRRILEAGYGFLFLEYRGYGGNPGKPSEMGLHTDARAALDFLASRGIPHENVILYGESLGCGIAVRAATEHHFSAVILEAPYTSIADVAQRQYWFLPVRWLVRDRYDTLAIINRITSPVVVIHGEQDDIIHVSFGKRVFAAAPEPKTAWFFEGAGHNNLQEFGFDTRLLDYLQQNRFR